MKLRNKKVIFSFNFRLPVSKKNWPKSRITKLDVSFFGHYGVM